MEWLTVVGVINGRTRTHSIYVNQSSVVLCNAESDAEVPKAVIIRKLL